MNSSERDTESLVPDIYEIEITEKSQKLLDINVIYNDTDTSINDTVGFSGEQVENINLSYKLFNIQRTYFPKISRE